MKEQQGGKSLFQIDLLSRTPIYEQLYNNIVQLILKDILKENEQLPSVRALAKELGVNPNTVQKAFQELERNQFIYTVAGRGNFVGAVNREVYVRKALEQIKTAVIEAVQIGVSKEVIRKMIDAIDDGSVQIGENGEGHD